MWGNGTVCYGYNDVPWARSDSPTDRFFYDCRPARRPLADLHTEAVRAARELCARYHGEEIQVLYSGGLDSEAVLEACRIAKVPVRALVLYDEKGSNEEELKHAARYLKRTGMLWTAIKFDFVDWLSSSECKALGALTEQAYRTMCLEYYVLKDMGGQVVTTGHEMSMKHVNGEWCVTEFEALYGLFKAFETFGLHGCPAFYMWDSELALSWYADPLWKHYLKNDRPGPNTARNYVLKSMLMFMHFQLEGRKKVDYIGPLRAEVTNDIPDSFHTRVCNYPLRPWLNQRCMETE